MACCRSCGRRSCLLEACIAGCARCAVAHVQAGKRAYVTGQSFIDFLQLSGRIHKCFKGFRAKQRCGIVPQTSNSHIYVLLVQSLVDLEDFIHMLREPPQPQEGSVSHLPDWLLPNEHSGRSSGSGINSSSSGSGTSSNSSGVSISGNGSGPARQLPEPAVITGSQLSFHEQGGAVTEQIADAALMSTRLSAQATSQQSSSADTLGRRRQAGLHVEFRDVSFRYSQSAGADRAQEDLWASVDFSAVESPAAAAATLAADAPMQLQGITFALQPGEALGIVGPPGTSVLLPPMLLPPIEW